jgi:hypothetical protein
MNEKLKIEFFKEKNKRKIFFVNFIFNLNLFFISDFILLIT